jgi:hypothetical protein
MRVLTLALAALVTACSLFTDLAAPDIECRGDQLPADACRSWGRSVIASSERRGERPARVVLTFNAGANKKCWADLYERTGRLLLTANVRCPASN